jgi:hypothetical protein
MLSKMTVGRKICIPWRVLLRHLHHEVLLTCDSRNRAFSTDYIKSHNWRRYWTSFKNVQFSKHSYMKSMLIPVLFSNLFRCLSSEIRHDARISYLYCSLFFDVNIKNNIRWHSINHKNSFFWDTQIRSLLHIQTQILNLSPLFSNISQTFSIT